MLSQKFTIVPVGYLKGGSASYMADEVTGAVEAIEDIDAQVMFIPYELKSDSNAKADPKMFLSANLAVGMELDFSTVKAVVTSIAKGSASVSLSMKDDENKIEGSGIVLLDLSKKFWSIKQIDIDVTVTVPFLGAIQQHIQALPVQETKHV